MRHFPVLSSFSSACLRPCSRVGYRTPSYHVAPLFSNVLLPARFWPPASASVVSHSQASHSSLESFLKHARQTSLDVSSTVYVGTLYEYLCLNTLHRFGFDLTRTGGAGDAGVDLAGTWTVPSHAIPIEAVVQCKALNRKTGPNMVRELEGALGTLQPGTIGVLCATKQATKGVRDTLRNSGSPLIWMQVEQTGETDAKVRQMLWNEEVERCGARGLSVGLRRGPSGVQNDDEIALVWQGELWEPEGLMK